MTETVLVTGATGFLGGHLCLELLRSTSATIHCIVRSRTDHSATRRLHAHLTRLNGPETGLDLDRVKATRGNMTEPRMGLPVAQYTRLADTVDGIYHCAATVDLAAPFTDLIPGNVTATQEAIRFAGHRRTKALHHISSVVVFAAARELSCPTVDENTEVSLAMAGTLGYGQSKYRAEEEIRRAAATGLPTTIYRAGVIFGSSRHWQFAETDLWTRLVRAAIEVGTAPESPGTIPGAPVDRIAADIVQLSRRPDAPGRVYHPNQAAPIPVAQVFDQARAYGYDLPKRAPAQWKEDLLGHAERPAAQLVLACWEGISYMIVPEPRYLPPTINSALTRSALNGSIDTGPEMILGTEFFTRMLDGITNTFPSHDHERC
ncbi:thioester reductase domain-containing protein [Streptosporangium sp. NBC_01810]|uniref:thioester reductase domain-containing protein n=1 Tax=Streptosporangium sp. NBC_01810 TaxID=2975951 RepID=UPI002DDA64C7|nr:thioester reductase domain-containing protein [Streptosporangium sp. NBC_01810]WSA25924.1 thioester reductase domain-containing protein [Streptosporangium sp. NBC_01810]